MRKMNLFTLSAIVTVVLFALSGSAQVPECAETDNQCLVDAYTKKIAADPGNIENYYSRGRAYRGLNKFDASIADLTKYISMKPSTPEYLADGYMARANTYTAMKDSVHAIADFGRAVGILPTHAEAYYNRARLYYDDKKYLKAIADLDQYIALNKSNKEWLADGYENRGVNFLALGKNDEALRDLTSAIGIDGTVARRFSTRADIYRKLGKIALAEADEKKAAELK